MGFRFRRSFKVAPGIRLNMGSKSMGLSVGSRGAHISTNTRTGTRATVGIPGTGLSYSQSLNGSRGRSAAPKAMSGGHVTLAPTANPFLVPAPQRIAFATLGCFGLLGALCILPSNAIAAALWLSGFYLVGWLIDSSHKDQRIAAEEINVVANRAWATVSAGDPADAITDLEYLQRKTPDNTLILYYLSAAVEGVDAGRGRELMLRFIKRQHAAGQPVDAMAFMTLGQHCLALNHPEEADRVYLEGQKAAGDQDMRDRFILCRALATHVSGNASLTLEILKTVNLQRKLPQDMILAVRFWRGQCLLDLGQSAAARKEFERVAAIDPTYRDVFSLLGGLNAG